MLQLKVPIMGRSLGPGASPWNLRHPWGLTPSLMSVRPKSLDPRLERLRDVRYPGRMTDKLAWIMLRCHCLTSAYSSESGSWKPWKWVMTSQRMV